MISAYTVRVTKTVRYVVMADSEKDAQKMAVDASAGRLKGGTNPIRAVETQIESCAVEATVPLGW
jgi:hypothetical protein